MELSNHKVNYKAIKRTLQIQKTEEEWNRQGKKKVQ